MKNIQSGEQNCKKITYGFEHIIVECTAIYKNWIDKSGRVIGGLIAIDMNLSIE